MAKPELKEVEPVYLQQFSILPWEKPTRPGYVSVLGMYAGSTELVNFMGLESFALEIPPYVLHASAAKYVADIARNTGLKWDEQKVEAKREILLDGNIIAFRSGEVPGTNFQGYSVAFNGKIWAATAKSPENTELRELIFEGKENRERILKIQTGYEMQEDSRRKSESSARLNSFREGVRAGESTGPSFHGGCC
jgi:hypothetical protein